MFHCIQSVARPLQADVSVAVYHIVFTFVYFKTASAFFLFYEHVLRRLYQSIVYGVDQFLNAEVSVFALRQSAAFFHIQYRRDVGISDGILHQDFSVQSFVFSLVPQYPVAFGNVRLGNDVGIVQYSQRSPHIRYKIIAHGFRIAGSGYRNSRKYGIDFIVDALIDVAVGAQFRSIDFLQIAALHQTLDRVFAGADQIDLFVALFDDRQHRFIGFEGRIGYGDTVFFLELGDEFFGYIIRPVIYHQSIAFGGFCRGGSRQNQRRRSERRHYEQRAYYNG